jgi:hypothetical protein
MVLTEEKKKFINMGWGGCVKWATPGSCFVRILSCPRWVWDLVHVNYEDCQHYKTVAKTNVNYKWQDWRKWVNNGEKNLKTIYVAYLCLSQTINKCCYRLLFLPTFLKYVFPKHSFFKILGLTEDSSFLVRASFKAQYLTFLFKSFHNLFHKQLSL